MNGLDRQPDPETGLFLPSNWHSPKAGNTPLFSYEPESDYIGPTSWSVGANVSGGASSQWHNFSGLTPVGSQVALAGEMTTQTKVVAVGAGLVLWWLVAGRKLFK